MRVPTLLLLACAIVSAAIPAMAQDHEHDMSAGMLLIMADLPADGRTVVGDISHFQYVLLDPDGMPFVHHDFHVDVALNDITLYSTEHGHDYDGVGELDVVFPVPGTYTVTVTVPLEASELNATYHGYVVPALDPVQATIRLDAPTQAALGEPVTFTYAVVDANDTLIPHTDALVTIRRLADDFVVLEAHTHSHGSDMAFTYQFEKGGAYDVRIVGYTAFPDAEATVFDPVVLHHAIALTGDDTPALPLGGASPPTPEKGNAEAVGYSTHVTADPVAGTKRNGIPTTGAFSQVRASHITYDDNMTLVQHIDYAAELNGPRGTIFQSSSLHEYDGVLTLMSADQAPGTYTWTFSASGQGWTDAQDYVYEVSPLVTRSTVGPQFLDTKGLDGLSVATPGTVEFFARSAAGMPFTHSEVMFEIQDDAGVPLLRQKLHTHSDGLFSFQAAMHDTREHTLRAELFDIHSSATPRYYGADMESGRALAFTPKDGATWPMPIMNATVPLEREQTLPAPALVPTLALLALVVLALARRRA